MQSFTPKRNVKFAGGVSLSLMIVALVLFALAGMDIFAARALLQLIATLFAVAGIFILTKYVLLSYVYTLSENDGEYDLLIAQISGKKSTTVARISVSDIAEVKQIDASERSYGKAYDYSAELLPKELLLLKIDEQGSVFYVKLLPDGDFIRALDSIRKN